MSAAVGGGIDLASGARRLIVTMTPTASGGEAKIVRECTLPLTAAGAVDMITTELAVFEFIDGQLTLMDRMPDVALDEVRGKTEVGFRTGS